MRMANITLRIMGAAAISTIICGGVSGCGAATTTIYQTVVVSSSPTTAIATATRAPLPTFPPPPPGIWCPVQQGLTPFTVNCEIYPSTPQLYNPPQGESELAGTQVGPEIGSDGPSKITESMRSPWAADVICATGDYSNTGKVRIIMIAHTGGRDYYSWGDEPCGPPAAPSYGNEFFRKATVAVTLSIQPLTGNLGSWGATLIQL